jgi:hypothetical protein
MDALTDGQRAGLTAKLQERQGQRAALQQQAQRLQQEALRYLEAATVVDGRIAELQEWLSEAPTDPAPAAPPVEPPAVLPDLSGDPLPA